MRVARVHRLSLTLPETVSTPVGALNPGFSLARMVQHGTTSIVLPHVH